MVSQGAGMNWLPDFKSEYPRVLIIGNFDGVHLGHQKLVQLALEKRTGFDTLVSVMTFEPHPSIVFAVKNFLLVQDYESRYACLKQSGADEVLAMPFTNGFSQMDSREFIRFLKDVIRPEAICVGFDFRFGHFGAGTGAQLQAEMNSANVPVYILPRHEILGQKVSSSRLRECLKMGDLQTVESMMGRKHFLTGCVSPGYGIGKGLGFPTINLNFQDLPLALAYGVYLIRASVLDEPEIKAIANYGVSPSFHGNEKPRLEIHFPHQTTGPWVDWSIGVKVKVEFERFIRPERHFSDPEELKTQISSDIGYYEEWF